MAKEGSGTIYKIQAGDAYVFDGHESHYLRGGPEGAKIICIFTPACTGKEVNKFPRQCFQLLKSEIAEIRNKMILFASNCKRELTIVRHLINYLDLDYIVRYVINTVQIQSTFAFLQVTQPDGSFPLLED